MNNTLKTSLSFSLFPTENIIGALNSSAPLLSCLFFNSLMDAQLNMSNLLLGCTAIECCERRVASSCLDSPSQYPLYSSLSPRLQLLWPVVQSVGKLSILVAEFSFVLGQFKVESLSWVSAHQVLSGVAKWRHICHCCSRIQSKGEVSPLLYSLALNFGRRAKAFGRNVCHYSPGLICKCRLDVNCRLSRQPNTDGKEREEEKKMATNQAQGKLSLDLNEARTDVTCHIDCLQLEQLCLFYTLSFTVLHYLLYLLLPSPRFSSPPLPVNLCTILSHLKDFSSSFTLFSFSSTYFLLTVEA